jgi:transposase-like protein
MDLARSRYSRDVKLSVMRAMDAGESGGRVARRVQISPKLIERRGAEWRARGEASFPGTGRRAGPKLPPEERTVAGSGAQDRPTHAAHVRGCEHCAKVLSVAPRG